MLLNRNEIKEELLSGVILVNFTKVNGEKRDMRCTLKQSLLPDLKESSDSSYEDKSIMTVWDVEAQGWRSFRLDSVNHIFNPAP